MTVGLCCSGASSQKFPRRLTPPGGSLHAEDLPIFPRQRICFVCLNCAYSIMPRPRSQPPSFFSREKGGKKSFTGYHPLLFSFMRSTKQTVISFFFAFGPAARCGAKFSMTPIFTSRFHHSMGIDGHSEAFFSGMRAKFSFFHKMAPCFLSELHKEPPERRAGRPRRAGAKHNQALDHCGRFVTFA